jgi:CRP-like cAMP-binding protein
LGEEEYEDGTIILKEDIKGDWLYVILEGEADVKVNRPTRMIKVDTLKEGEIFGEVPLFGETKGLRTASIVAHGQIRVGILDKERMKTEFEGLSPPLRELLTSLVSKLAMTTKEVSLLAVKAADEAG